MPKLSNALWALALLVGFVSVAWPPLIVGAVALACAALGVGPSDTVAS